MAAEAVSSATFQAAFDALDEQTQFEVDWAISMIEDDPGWSPGRYVAPADSPYAGFMIDFTVEGRGIVYRTVDKGAAVELWYLYELPPPPKEARARRPGPTPAM